ncbi:MULTISPECIES: hypothetical protein [unclassified Roseofilum]|uniref:hypothetical protein n=1 Tax=unclassified Roseofilum TaxID=2620099 RepID=UPI001B09B3F3|nr:MULTISPECIES: hypothetical protein [unclassified Roseofilum]MBP0011411.1 hypothetical protein [Roseofilum sp. Belize Diploria]MBP0011562.1 hypothetical protein [Roseofilum sp. SID3]MBP0024827.1 hypothetical protein [Roseofilum sp. SID2]MBP0035944.1 hypothetical protein [Roseofilum sp. Belize BBD 4]MBP0036978.1 hypothetical protein [Roseofilum sp. SID1]
MSYREFTLAKVKQDFGLITFEQSDIFAESPELTASDLLIDILNYNQPIALGSNSEKARSELIISPILVDLRRQLKEKINLFSGVDFTVDDARGLNGICDFIITQSPELLIVTTPVIIVVEAKKENINAGLGQCAAAMVAAQMFNATHELSLEDSADYINTIYGAVTTGSIWQFLKLDEKQLSIDLSEYYLKDVNKILGILASGIADGN